MGVTVGKRGSGCEERGSMGVTVGRRGGGCDCGEERGWV